MMLTQILTLFVAYAVGSELEIHPNSVLDPLEGWQACGASGFILDAPIPEWRDRKHRRQKRAATNHKFRIWPSGIIPYVIDTKMSKAGENLIRRSMNHWENQTCVKFVKRKFEPDYIHIVKGKGCCSYVGRKGGRQFVSLGAGCLRFGIVTHELGHVIGFWHEQNRPDRSIYIDVIYDNVDASKYLNFDPRSENEIDTFDQIYDLNSIMHYGTRFFTKNGKATIRNKKYKADKDYHLVPGNTNTNEIGKSYYKFEGPVLSKHDIMETNLLYKCSKLTECGGALFASTGSFTSVNFPNPYPQREERECFWVITTTRNKKYKDKYTTLTLIFDSFDVGNSDEKNDNLCNNDYVEIREGKGYLSPFIIRFCGNRTPAPITTLSGSLYVGFHVTAHNANNVIESKQGFKASFKTDVCSQIITSFPATIHTPQFPFAYPSAKDCLWSLQASKGMKLNLFFKFFLLREHSSQEGCLDFLEIHEGDGNFNRFVGRYCGSNNPQVVVSTHNKLKVHFHSSSLNQRGWYMGFQAKVTEEDIDECKTKNHGCSQACINYPGGYFCGCYPGYKTVYKYPLRKAECLDKDECDINNGGCSHICINSDGSYTCACPKGFMLSENGTDCSDINECTLSDSPCDQMCTNTIGGYQCSCKAGYILQNDQRTCSEIPFCLATFTSPVGSLSTPTIRKFQNNPVTCFWKFEIPKYLQLVFSFIVDWDDNKNCSTYLRVYESEKKKIYNMPIAKICSSSDVPNKLKMPGNTAFIEYQSVGRHLPTAAVRYHSIDPNQHSCNSKMNVTNGRIITPGYPVKYPTNIQCTWYVYSPNKKKMRLKFGHFNIEFHKNCEFDHILIEQHYYNSPSMVKRIGKFCGKTKPPIIYFNGAVSFLKIVFSSDATMSQKGVKMLLKEIDFL